MHIGLLSIVHLLASPVQACQHDTGKEIQYKGPISRRPHNFDERASDIATFCDFIVKGQKLLSQLSGASPKTLSTFGNSNEFTTLNNAMVSAGWADEATLTQQLNNLQWTASNGAAGTLLSTWPPDAAQNRAMSASSAAFTALGIPSQASGYKFQAAFHTMQTLTGGQSAVDVFFINAVNANHGAILAFNNKSPAGAVSLSAKQNGGVAQIVTPLLQTWADMVYLAWKQNAAEQNSDPSNLKYIFRLSITNEPTTFVINQILTEQGKASLPKWPGLQFQVDSDEAKALLGTPNGSGPVWLLIQHNEFENLRVVSVTIYQSSEGANMVIQVGPQS